MAIYRGHFFGEDMTIDETACRIRWYSAVAATASRPLPVTQGRDAPREEGCRQNEAAYLLFLSVPPDEPRRLRRHNDARRDREDAAPAKFLGRPTFAEIAAALAEAPEAGHQRQFRPQSFEAVRLATGVPKWLHLSSRKEKCQNPWKKYRNRHPRYKPAALVAEARWSLPMTAK